jgi:nucleobase:cation symporter-1, NCS1 family
LLAGMTAAAMTMKSPLYTGPIAIALGGADLSWIVGLAASALIYAGLTRFNERRADALGLAAD